MKKNTVLASTLALAVILIGVGIHTNVIKLPFERTVEVSLPQGFETDPGFVGLSHNIFVGKVIKNIGQITTETIPETRFQIQVISNIKGTLPEKVIMNQEGGYENGVLVRMEENGQLLKEGSTYLLAARTDGNGRYVVFFYPRGTTLLSSDQSLSSNALKTLAATNKDVLGLQEAYKTEVLIDADVQSKSTYNSYKKLVTFPAIPAAPQTWN